MDATGFDSENDWHSTINLVFTLLCDQCSASADLEWPAADDGNDGFLRRCVELAERCQASGWTHRGGARFRCPTCSEQRPGE